MRITVVKDNIIRLRGTIWEGDGDYVSQKIEEVQQVYNHLVTHANGYGGSVFDANLIFNTLIREGYTTDVVIDSVAASMYSILLQTGVKRSMARNAQLMIHAPWTRLTGNAEELEKQAKLLRDMEDEFVRVFLDRTDKSETEVREWLKGDNWFSAEDALREGLIDEIHDPVYTDEQIAALKNSNIQGMVKGDDDPFERVLGNPTTPPNIQNHKIMKGQIIAQFGLVGVSEQSSETAVIEAVNAKMNALQASNDAKDETIESLKGEQQAIKDNMINKAVEAGKITKEIGEAYKTVDSISALSTMLSAIGGTPNISATLVDGSNDKTPQKAAYSTWDEFQDKDPRGLERLQESDFDTFNALFKAKYSKDYEK